MNRAGCLPKSVALAERVGQELLQLARQARAEGRISDTDWQKLPTTPDGMLNLLMGQAVEKDIIEALLKTYGKSAL